MSREWFIHGVKPAGRPMRAANIRRRGLLITAGRCRFYTLPVLTTPDRSGGTTTASAIPPSARDADLLRAAFRDVHGTRLHGFALLVTLGDRGRASVAAGKALAEGSRRAGRLHHPERAAAWLRARLLRNLRGPRVGGGPPEADRRAALVELGVAPAAYRGLAALSANGRAALVASAVERFGPIDLEIILGAEQRTVRGSIAAARRRYLSAAVSDESPDTSAYSRGDATGELAGRVMGVVDRTLERGGGR